MSNIPRMTQDVQAAIATWKQADAEARAVEALLARARDEYEAKRGPAVPGELLQQVSKARRRANDKLSVALAMIRIKSSTPA